MANRNVINRFVLLHISCVLQPAEQRLLTSTLQIIGKVLSKLCHDKNTKYKPFEVLAVPEKNRLFETRLFCLITILLVFSFLT